jgi:hypothetical protein
MIDTGAVDLSLDDVGWDLGRFYGRLAQTYYMPEPREQTP